jgi:hypothetical protein
MASNVLVRFIWVFYIPKPTTDVPLKSFIFATMEMLRRWQWNFFRVETEQVGNTDQYRVTREGMSWCSRSQSGLILISLLTVFQYRCPTGWFRMMTTRTNRWLASAPASKLTDSDSGVPLSVSDTGGKRFSQHEHARVFLIGRSMQVLEAMMRTATIRRVRRAVCPCP